MQTATGNLVFTALPAGEKQAPDIQLVSLNELILERAHLYNQLCGTRISMATELQSDLDWLIIQELPLERLLLNLVLCAKYSMPFGGQLQLSTSNISVADEKYVRLLLNMRRNPPDESIPPLFDRHRDVKLSRRAMSVIVSSNRGTIAVCQQTELISFTEILLPSTVSPQPRTHSPASEKRITASPT